MKKELTGQEEKNDVYITKEEFYNINKNTEKKLNETDRKIEKIIHDIYKVNEDLSYISGDIKYYEELLQKQRKLLMEQKDSRKHESIFFFKKLSQIKKALFISLTVLLLMFIEYLLI